jgi:hypothetical protein
VAIITETGKYRKVTRKGVAFLCGGEFGNAKKIF